MAKKKKGDSTNAIRLVSLSKFIYEVREYDISDGKIDGVSVSDKIGLPYENVYKTLVTRETTGNLFVFVIPVNRTLDLKKAAQCVGVKKIEMIHVKEMISLTGYQKGGCSPIGMKKQFPTVIDSACKKKDYIVISAGKIGLQLVMPPEAIISLTHAMLGDITQEGI